MVSKWNGRRAALGGGLGLALLAVAGCSGAPEPQAVQSAAATAVVECSPVAAHPRHAGTSCTTCHLCLGAGDATSGGVVFNPAGPAVTAGGPAPAFDAAAKSCSNVACHAVPAGTFSYYFPGGDGEPELRTVSYGGASTPTPSWLATGLGCGACHGNPPRNGIWHSGYHAGQGPTGAANQCQFCHPDATSTNGVGTAITSPALHGNRVVDVAARFRTSCFGCH